MKLFAATLIFAVTAAAVIRSGDAIGTNGLGFRIRGIAEPVASRSARSPTVGWITQPVDHFNPRDNRTWSMRYFENDQFLSGSNAPILIMLGGEWAIGPGWLQSGQMFDIASTHGAMLYYTEHRYYGLSYPTNTTSSENLQFLSVDQALADVAYFIEAMKKERNLDNSTVVVFGGSYAGNMATWARLKYPHLIKGALASSAPVFAKADFYEYFEVVTEALARYDPECTTNIKEAVEAVEQLTETTVGAALLTRYFGLCNRLNISSWQDKANFASSIASTFAGVVQYDTVDANGQSSIGNVCNYMTASYLGSPVQRLAYLFNLQGGCSDVTYTSLIDFYSDEDWNSQAATSAMRLWLYQTCTEYGYYQTSNSENSVFGSLFTVEFYHEICKDLYGKYYNEELLDSAVKRTNIMFGGFTPGVSNVIFTNGDIDPWHVLSVLEDLNESSPAIVVSGASHCQDLYSDRATDSVEMLSAKARVREIVGEWIS